MQLVVKASSQQQQAFLSKNLPSDVHVYWYGTDDIPEKADAWFDLSFEEDGQAFPTIADAPIFVNAVLTTTDKLPKNYIRINAWNSFFERTSIEIAAGNNETKADTILNALGWAYTHVPDVPGFIAARVIAMIINEAYFAFGDEVSSKIDIDTAMKLGTNYPYGPFEWCDIIGIQRIYQLLSLLEKEDDRYAPAPALIAEVLIKKQQA